MLRGLWCLHVISFSTTITNLTADSNSVQCDNRKVKSQSLGPTIFKLNVEARDVKADLNMFFWLKITVKRNTKLLKLKYMTSHLKACDSRMH